MASEKSDIEPMPKSEAERNADDPRESIQKILEIVGNLNTIFPTQVMKILPTVTSGLTDSLNVRELELIPNLQRNLRIMKKGVINLRELNQEVERINSFVRPLDKLIQKVVVNPSMNNLTIGMKKDLMHINKEIVNIIPLLPNKHRKSKQSVSHADDEANNGRPIVCLPGVHANEEDLKRLAVFRYVQSEFDKLSVTPHLQICLLSFAVFPENQEVNRTMLMYWWIGEGILPVSGAEDAVKKILNDFKEKRLIESVENKRKVESNSYKMTPFVHSSVVLISKEIGLFDMYRSGEKPTMNKSKLNKVCLVEGSSSQKEAKRMQKAHLIETVFNVSERFPDFTSKWFSSMNNLKVLYLGRWERAVREIEVDSRRVMKDLSHLRRLRFLSFQGISNIKRLGTSACKLTMLIILDLRGCDNLEELPKRIHRLKNLIYLDLTGCKALESIPMGLASLLNLEVLKGFVVSNGREITCNLNDIKHLSKLRKLNVTVDRDDFDLHELIVAIKGFDSLEKLKVWWASGFSLRKKQRDSKGNDNSVGCYSLPIKLRKLDLQRFPDSELPDWLQPENLLNLEKLHLGSSRRLKGFGDLKGEPTRCSVEVLRLKCLPKLRVEWRELKYLYFPKLNFFESYECPRVTFCPYDRDGIWRSDERV